MFSKLISDGFAEIIGNEAAEDENPKILNSYFVTRPDFLKFEDEKIRFRIVRGRKGMGKSALLSRLAYIKYRHNEADFVFLVKGDDLVSQKKFDTNNPSELIFDWKQRICNRLNLEIGKAIGFAFDATDMAMVENSEIVGFKGKNLVSALLDRIGNKLGNFEFTKSSPTNAQALLNNYMESHKNPTIWLLIDDIDATFKRAGDEVIKLSTFFSACRDLSNSVQGLVLRCSVRADVWNIIGSTDEALDKCEQYMFDIDWGASGTKKIFANRIRSYVLRRLGKEVDDLPELSSDELDSYLNYLFPQSYRWDGVWADPTRVIHILASARPRWALQLCRLSVENFVQEQGRFPAQITFGLINAVARKYGKLRFDDIIREHSQQCPKVKDIILAFSKTKRMFSSTELFDHIEKNIVSASQIYIDDSSMPASSMQIANFLFRIGFISASSGNREGDGTVMHFTFDKQPYLLSTETIVDTNFYWEIHPLFFYPLNLAIKKGLPSWHV